MNGILGLKKQSGGFWNLIDGCILSTYYGLMIENTRLLLVDDDVTALNLMSELLTERGYSADSVTSVADAEELLQKSAYNVLISDLRMPERTGMDLLDQCMKSYPEMPVILITGHGTIRNAVEALKKGAFEYISKPVQMDELVLAIDKAVKHSKLVNQNRFLKKELDKSRDFLFETGNKKLLSIYKTIEKIRNEKTSVLLQGESGTGKEMIARLIHNSGKRAQGSFVPINCGAIPENLIESELFGYEKGSFTGAHKRTAGKLLDADGGTLFLDEIDELPPKAQVAMLRFMQDHIIIPLGSSRQIKVDVRVIAATNSELHQQVQDGEFREDLYYRINVLPLHLPPLRERKEDILPLTEWFLKHFQTRSNRRACGISKEAEKLLLEYSWPGNIRELRNCMDRASIICQNEIVEAEDLLFLSARTLIDSGEFPFDGFGMQPLKKIEDAYIQWVLDKCEGNKTRAAEVLGISLRGLRYKLNSNENADGPAVEGQ
jgi:DNA-binding NtrC family response regulator